MHRGSCITRRSILPVTTGGDVTLITPEWIPGNHRPTGPVEDITGVVIFTVDGKAGSMAARR